MAYEDDVVATMTLLDQAGLLGRDDLREAFEEFLDAFDLLFHPDNVALSPIGRWRVVARLSTVLGGHCGETCHSERASSSST